MTVFNAGSVSHKQNFYGLSTDVKPTSAYIGDIFTEIDTGDEFYWNGVAWVSFAGKFGIDQTTDGITNKVQSRNATHDNFNANANLQVGDIDVSDLNPVPVKLFVSSTPLSNTNALPVRSNYLDFTFHDESATPTSGSELNVEFYKILTVEIYGTSSARTINFRCTVASDTSMVLQGIKISDFTLASSTTGNAEIWQFDIEGLTTVFFDLTSVTDGYVSIKGRVTT